MGVQSDVGRDRSDGHCYPFGGHLPLGADDDLEFCDDFHHQPAAAVVLPFAGRTMERNPCRLTARMAVKRLMANGLWLMAILLRLSGVWPIVYGL